MALTSGTMRETALWMVLNWSFLSISWGLQNLTVVDGNLRPEEVVTIRACHRLASPSAVKVDKRFRIRWIDWLKRPTAPFVWGW